jgi:hypothetical protein
MAQSKGSKRHDGSNAMLFNPWNYKVLTLGLLLVVIGFTLMYLENEVNGFISLYLSPVMIMAGYLTVILAIMKPGDAQNATSDTTRN